jgi:hypothetical protein
VLESAQAAPPGPNSPAPLTGPPDEGFTFETGGSIAAAGEGGSAQAAPNNPAPLTGRSDEGFTSETGGSAAAAGEGGSGRSACGEKPSLPGAISPLPRGGYDTTPGAETDTETESARDVLSEETEEDRAVDAHRGPSLSGGGRENAMRKGLTKCAPNKRRKRDAYQ